MTQLNELDRTSLSRFRALVKWSSILTFFVISLGSLVRATDSGLACPDWPLCYGKAIPVFDTQIFLEWFHRVVAGVLTIMIVWGSVIVMRRPTLRKLFSKQLLCAVGLLFIQIILGGLTVLKLLDPKTVAAHLTNALLFFTVLMWIGIRAGNILNPEKVAKAAPPIARWSLVAFTILMFSQVVLGGAVSTNHAGLACPDFPTCHGMWVPPASFLIWLQVSHRILAFVLLAFAIGLTVWTAHSPLPRMTRMVVRLMPALIIAQIGLGLVNVFYSLPVWASVAHLANAALMYTLLFLATINCFGHRATATVGLQSTTSQTRGPQLVRPEGAPV